MATAQPLFDQRMSASQGDVGFKLDEKNEVGVTKFQKFMLFLSKYPASENYPRNTTGTITLEKDATGKVVTVRQSDLLSRVFNIFMTEGFMGAPVLNETDDYVGFVDLLDIVAFTTKLLASEEDSGSAGQGDVDMFMAKSRAFRRATVGDFDVMFRVNKPPVATLRQECSLMHVLETLVYGSQRRVALVDSFGYISGIVTESMMISTIAQNLQHLGEAGDLLVSDLIPDLRFWMDSVSHNEKAIVAFEKMVHRNRAGLPVVDQNGVMVDTISIRDLRGIGSIGERFQSLWKTVKEYKDETRRMFPMQTPWHPIVVTKNDTLRRVIELMDDGNIHRVYMVEDLLVPKPLFVISQLDVLRTLLLFFRKSPSPLRSIVHQPIVQPTSQPVTTPSVPTSFTEPLNAPTSSTTPATSMMQPADVTVKSPRAGSPPLSNMTSPTGQQAVMNKETERFSEVHI